MDEETRQALGMELYLAASCFGDSLAEVRRLLKQGAGLNWKGKDGLTALHEACNCNNPDIVKMIMGSNDVHINEQDDAGNTALHIACQMGFIDCVKLLTGAKQCDLGIVNKCNRTPLEDAVHGGHLNVLQYFITTLMVDVNGSITESGYSLLGLAICEGKFTIVKYLVDEQGVDIDVPVTKFGDTPLGVAIHKEKLDISKYLITEKSVDLNGPITKSGNISPSVTICEGGSGIVKYFANKQTVDVNALSSKSEETPLSMAICEGKVDFLKYLATEIPDLEINEKHLFLAIQYDQAEVVEYFLTTLHINPNARNNKQKLAVSLAKSKRVVALLLQHGAHDDNVYTDHRKTLDNIFPKKPMKSPVKMFVIGQGGEGKSTLIEALEHEPTVLDSVTSVFTAPKEVDGVCQRTAGIIPRVFKSRLYGDVLFYDFAGQEAYYSSHAAVIKSSVNMCPPIFLLVVGLHREYTSIRHSIFYWLSTITNQCINMEGKAPLIVIGSHADLVGNTEIDRIKAVVFSAVQKFTLFDYVDLVPVDCRYSNSTGMKSLRSHIEASCASMQCKLSLPLNSHMFLTFLEKNFSSKVAVEFQEVQYELEACITLKSTEENRGNLLQGVKEKLEAVLDQESAKQKETLSLIPTTVRHLKEICLQLSDKGHILFLPNEKSPEKSYIVIDKRTLLSEIIGNVFAPEDFKQHCELATSTGIVPQSKVAKHFPMYDIEFVIKCLSYFELAVPIEDPKILVLINQHVAKDESYLFCPSLIRLQVPPKVFLHQRNQLYRFGWVLSCVRVHDFFDARFLHVLILKLALSVGMAPVVDPEFPALQQQCSVWKTGLHWNTSKGAEILLDVVDKKKVVVLIQNQNISFHLLELQSSVLKKVIATATELCPSIITEELLLSPSEVVYPLNISQETVLFSLRSLAESIVKQDPFVVSTSGTERLSVIDHEVYANLGENILQALFNENDPAHYTRVTDRFLSAVSLLWSKIPFLIQIICSAITADANLGPQSSKKDIEVALRSWRDSSNGTYRSLRQILDQLSVFAGKSPLEIAGVQAKDFDEKLLPPLEPEVSQPSSKDGSASQTKVSRKESIVSNMQTDVNMQEVAGAHSKEFNQQLSPDFSQPSRTGVLTIENLKEEFKISDNQLNTVIENNLYELAGCFDNLERYIDKFGLNHSQRTHIKDIAKQKDCQTAMKEALKLWGQPNPYAATFRALIEIVLNVKRGDVARNICRYITE